jgi:hypothetical protein
VGSAGLLRCALTAHTLNGSGSCGSSLALGCVVFGDTLGLLWVIRGMIRQDALEQAAGFVTDRDEGPWSRTLARGLLLAARIVGLAMRRLRKKAHRIVREPRAERGTAHVRDRRKFSAPRPTCKHPQIGASALDELCAVLVLMHIAPGGQEGRSRGLAAPGQRPQAWGVRSMCKEVEGLGEPELCFRQGRDEVAWQGGALERVAARGGLETNAGWGQVLEVGEGLRTPLTATLAGRPLFYDACASVAQDRGWGRLGWPAAQSGRWRQVVHEGMECRKREGQSGSPWVAQLAAPFLQGHGSPHQAVGGRACRITGNGQQAPARAQAVEDTRSIFSSVLLVPSCSVWRLVRPAGQCTRQTA